MYLFCSDSSAVLESRLLHDAARLFGTIKLIQNSGGCLIWVNTSMSRLHRTEDHVRVELFLPGENGESTNTFDWDMETGIVKFGRSWRGVFTTFFSDRSPLIVTSHKKLAALFLKKAVPLKTVPAAGTGLLDLAKRAKPRIQQARPGPRWDGLADPSFEEGRNRRAEQRRNVFARQMP